MTFHIVSGKNSQRAAYWNDIKSRVTTHEGEILSGDKGRKYQEKYSEKMLGRDISGGPKMTEADVQRHEYNERKKREK